MGKYLLLSSFFLPWLVVRTPEASLSVQEQYVRDYRELAVQEMERTGVPASIKLAQAILESNAGRSELALRARNHFGIKCGASWDGPVFKLDDDEHDERGQRIPSCFRAYHNVADSYADHSDFLRQPEKEGRYGFLLRLPPTDYRGWALGLQKAGYATNKQYARQLIDIIERFRLDQYDVLGADASDRLAGIGRINDVRLAFARPEETIDDIAERTGVSASRLFRYNDQIYKPDQVLDENALVYLQPKRSFFRGKQRWHKVKPGETLAAIAQAYGIRTDKLRSKNRIPNGHEPLPGERIKLRWKVSHRQAPRTTPAGHVPEAVPSSGPMAAPSPATTPVAPPVARSSDAALAVPGPPPVPAGENWHTVAPGETLWRIARQYGVTISQIRTWNALPSDHIQTGQRLRIR